MISVSLLIFYFSAEKPKLSAAAEPFEPKPPGTEEVVIEDRVSLAQKML